MFKSIYSNSLFFLIGALAWSSCSKAPLKLIKQRDVASGLKTGFKSNYIGINAFLKHEHYVIFAMGEHKLAVYDLNKSRIIKKYKLAGQMDSSPYISKTQLYAGTINGYVHCIDMMSKKMLWTKSVNEAVVGAIAGDHEKIYVSTAQDTVVSLNKRSGEINWTYEKELYEANSLTNLSASPVIDHSNATGRFPLLDGRVVKLNLRNGRLISENIDFSSIKNEGLSVYKQYENYQYASQHKSTAILSKLSSGEIIWETGSFGTYAEPLMASDVAYLPLGNGNIEKINLQTGSPIWKFTGKTGSWLSLAKIDSFILASDAKGNTYIINSEDGKLAWTYKHRRNLVGHPVIHNKKAFLFTQEGAIYILSLKNAK